MNIDLMIILVFLACLAGFFSAMTGGSGMIMLPTLLVTGMPPQMALGTNKIFTTSGLFLASYTFFKKKIYHPRFWLLACTTTVVGSFFGAELIHKIPMNVVKIIVPIIIIAAALYFYISKKIKQKTEPIETPAVPSFKQRCQQIALGSCLGIYSGGVGAATGTVWTAFLTRVFKISLLEATALSRFLCFLSNLTAFATFSYLHEVDFKVGLLIALAGMLGARIGAHITIKVSENFIRTVLISVTCIIAFAYIYENWLR